MAAEFLSVPCRSRLGLVAGLWRQAGPPHRQHWHRQESPALSSRTGRSRSVARRSHHRLRAARRRAGNSLVAAAFASTSRVPFPTVAAMRYLAADVGGTFTDLVL